MGIKLWSSDDGYSPIKREPNYHNWECRDLYCGEKYVAVQLKYNDCQNLNGNKILVITREYYDKLNEIMKVEKRR